MPRQTRLYAPGALHHVVGRGIDGIKIFGNKKDREDFLIRLADLCNAGALRAYAWALVMSQLAVPDELPQIKISLNRFGTNVPLYVNEHD